MFNETIILYYISSFSIALVILVRVFYDRKRNLIRQKSRNKTLIAFFHPHCAGGGGGERVLWKAIQALIELGDVGFKSSIAVYTSDVYSASYRQGKRITMCDFPPWY